jgi:hypothetical protein
MTKSQRCRQPTSAPNATGHFARQLDQWSAARRATLIDPGRWSSTGGRSAQKCSILDLRRIHTYVEQTAGPTRTPCAVHGAFFYPDAVMVVSD